MQHRVIEVLYILSALGVNTNKTLGAALVFEHDRLPLVHDGGLGQHLLESITNREPPQAGWRSVWSNGLSPHACRGLPTADINRRIAGKHGGGGGGSGGWDVLNGW